LRCYATWFWGWNGFYRYVVPTGLKWRHAAAASCKIKINPDLLGIDGNLTTLLFKGESLEYLPVRRFGRCWFYITIGTMPTATFTTIASLEQIALRKYIEAVFYVKVLIFYENLWWISMFGARSHRTKIIKIHKTS
jgi:hypothetical protein